MPRSSRYLESKWRKFFLFLDTNCDGKLTFNDLDLLSRDFATSVGLHRSSKTKLHQVWLNWWVLMEQITGEICLDLSLAQFTQAMKQVLIYPKHCERFEEIWERMFDVLDEDGDGSLSLQELSLLYQWHGVHSESYAREVFRNLDINSDGMIAREEFLQAINLFWFDDDPNDDYSFMFSDTPTASPRRKNTTNRQSFNPVSSAKRFVLCCWM